MGWLDDFVSNPVATVSNTVNREVSNFSNSVNASIDNSSRGDVGRFVADSFSAVKSLAVAPLETAYYGVRGNGREVNNTLQRAIGGLTNVSGGLSVNLAQNNQSFYRDKNLNAVTLGYAEDFAGFSRGARTLQNDAYLSSEDKNSAIRYGVKTGIIGAAVSYGPGLYTKAKANFFETTAGAGLIGSLAKGDNKGAASAFANLTGTPDLSNYIPQPMNEVPSYISQPKSPSSAPYGSGGVTVKDPWSFSGVSDSGIVNAAQASILPIALGVGVLAFIYFRGLK